MSDRLESIIIDAGCHTWKVGFAGDAETTAIFPPIYGEYRIGNGGESKKTIYEQMAIDAQGLPGLKMSDPMLLDGGTLTNWDGFEQIFHYTFYDKLQAAPEDFPVLLTANSRIFSNASSREKVTQIMFEAFNVPAFCLANHPVLSVYASGRTSGVVVDCGEVSSSVVPVYDGRPLRHLTREAITSGSDITNQLERFLHHRGYNFTYPERFSVVRSMKEKNCFISVHPERGSSSISQSDSQERSYELPDGQMISLGDECFLAPEALFRPSIIGFEACGIETTVDMVIRNCDDKISSELYRSILLSGGTTLFPGFAIRLQNELQALASVDTQIKLIAPPERMKSAWIGGSIVGSAEMFKAIWCSKQTYDEAGPGVAHHMCF